MTKTRARLFGPTCLGGQSRDLAALLSGQPCGSRPPAFPSKLNGGLVLAGLCLVDILWDFARGDPHHLDGGAYHVGWAFLASRSFRHG